MSIRLCQSETASPRPTPARRVRAALFVAFAVLAAAAAAPRAAAAQPAPLAGLDAWIERALPAWEVPGLAIAVVRNDSVIHARGYGVRELGGADRVDEHTLFAIASTTKAFTAAALGMLVDEGTLGWDDHVSRWLPEFQLVDPFITRSLTVRDLLTHRSGIARSDNIWIAAPYDRGEILRRARHLPVAGAFRSEYGYHNVMYIAAGETVAAATSQSWDDFLEQRIFRPLGMTRSTSRAAVVETRGNVATSHSRDDGRVVIMPRRNYDNIGGAGAVFSSAHDLARWLRLQLGRGEFDGKRLIEAGTVREMHAPQTVMRADTVAERMFPGTNFRAYGLGWNLQDYDGHKIVHHSGTINYTRTHVAMVPDRNIGVAVIANLSTSDLQRAVMLRVIDALLGLPPREWSDEYLELARRANERSAEQAASLDAARLTDTRPSLPLERYAGTFTNALYDDVTLTLEDGRLVLRYTPDYVADLEHWHLDTFRAAWRTAGFGRAFIAFTIDPRGRAQRLELDGFGTFERR
jgi:CubicO group peptidase (beta-lactamase class C family)